MKTSSKLPVIWLLLLLAAVFKAVIDKLQFHFHKSRFQSLGKWWNPEQSWALKWKNGNPEDGERFWLSSTVLVWLTDAWHFFQMLYLSSWQFAIAYLLSDTWYKILIYFLVLKTFESLAFEIMFKFGLKSNNLVNQQPPA